MKVTFSSFNLSHWLSIAQGAIPSIRCESRLFHTTVHALMKRQATQPPPTPQLLIYIFVLQLPHITIFPFKNFTFFNVFLVTFFLKRFLLMKKSKRILFFFKEILINILLISVKIYLNIFMKKKVISLLTKIMSKFFKNNLLTIALKTPINITLY